MADEREGESKIALQQAVMELQRFWATEGCLLLPSCDFEIAAGTLHPDTFFHLLGGEPWRAAYLQPVRRPLDGRRRDHPFRLAKHLQFQVLLKPPPEDIQGLYLRSLSAVGFELEVHDARFADWSWESAALGAWGSGWHVLVDGLGITRMTFLQQAAGQALEPVSVELTYGLERLAMLLAGVATADDVAWAEGGPRYGRLRRRDEAEFSQNAFEVADTADHRQRFDALEREARRRLAGPAYELTVQGLLPIEILETRGDLSARERDDRTGRVEHLVSAAAVLRAGDGRSEAEVEASGAPVAEDEGRPAKKKPAPRRKRRKKLARRKKPATGEEADGG